MATCLELEPNLAALSYLGIVVLRLLKSFSKSHVVRVDQRD